MKKKEYRKIIVELTKMNKSLEESNKALKEQCLRLNANHRRGKIHVIAKLWELQLNIGAECMIPESEVVQKCIEAVKEYYV